MPIISKRRATAEIFLKYHFSDVSLLTNTLLVALGAVLSQPRFGSRCFEAALNRAGAVLVAGRRSGGRAKTHIQCHRQCTYTCSTPLARYHRPHRPALTLLLCDNMHQRYCDNAQVQTRSPGASTQPQVSALPRLPAGDCMWGGSGQEPCVANPCVNSAFIPWILCIGGSLSSADASPSCYPGVCRPTAALRRTTHKHSRQCIGQPHDCAAALVAVQPQ